jgi:hypothetical protein
VAAFFYVEDETVLLPTLPADASTLRGRAPVTSTRRSPRHLPGQVRLTARRLGAIRLISVDRRGSPTRAAAEVGDSRPGDQRRYGLLPPQAPLSTDEAALAAYNAGQANVDEWVADGREEIPFPETREFVENVLEAQEVYERAYADELGLNP